jgi:3-hydroxyisobutyrate dehydrogenase-like beta-hydroxyacid dehydrogenase
MTSLSRVAFVGLGEAGPMFAGEFAARGGLQISAFDLAFDQEGSAQAAAAKAIGIRTAPTAAEAVAGAQLVISAVTASSDLDAARSVVGHLLPGAYFLDINSVAPGTKRTAAAMIESAGGRYVDAAVMAPVYPKKLGTPILLGGPHAASFQSAAGELGLNTSVFSHEVGAASAVKMCRSVMIKGMEALTMECLLSARAAGVEEHVLASLKESFPTLDWPKIAAYNLERMTTHGIRRSAEMREVAKTVQELGVAPLMSAAAAEHQATIGGLRLKERSGGTLTENLSGMVDAIRAARPWPAIRAQAAG